MTTTFIDASGQSHPQISSDPVAVLRLGLRLELGTPLVNEVNRWLAGKLAVGTVVEVGQHGRARSYLDFNNAAIAEFVAPVGTPRVAPTARWPSRRRSAPRLLAPTITPPLCCCGKAGPCQ